MEEGVLEEVLRPWYLLRGLAFCFEGMIIGFKTTNVGQCVSAGVGVCGMWVRGWLSYCCCILPKFQTERPPSNQHLMQNYSNQSICYVKCIMTSDCEVFAEPSEDMVQNRLTRLQSQHRCHHHSSQPNSSYPFTCRSTGIILLPTAFCSRQVLAAIMACASVSLADAGSCHDPWWLAISAGTIVLADTSDKACQGHCTGPGHSPRGR